MGSFVALFLLLNERISLIIIILLKLFVQRLKRDQIMQFNVFGWVCQW